ncbi:MAG: ATP-binding cassette domain-containing protein, partial [Moorella sp. (in: Bacteria)]|nr:ATP-binding cassette domain-containing protein [Moorella sp. (in: firmicutes)]
AGRVLVSGEDITAMDEQELTRFRRTQTAMIFQHYGLLPHRTILENVAFGLKLRGVKREEREAAARKAIKQVGLDGWESHYPAALSGGMQQRVGIARALVQDPELLLMDEPFSGLDPLIRREMQDELIRLQEELHKTIVFVTHDLNEALRLGDRMAVMRDGVFVQVGRPQEIVQHPADDYVARFVQDERRIAHMAEAGVKRAVLRGKEPRIQPANREKQAAGR